MAVPYTFSTATSAIPLSQLDSNFATTITLGNTAIQLGNTVTTLNNMTLANVTISSGNTTVTSETISGNLTFTGTGNRIRGDFSNTTISSSTAFQTSVANSATSIVAIPSGTNNVSAFTTLNSSSPDNSSYGQIFVSASTVGLVSEKLGTGTYLPMTFTVGGSERMRLDTSGNLGIGTTSPGAYKLNVNGASVNIGATGTGSPSLQAVTTDAAGISYLALQNGTRNFSIRDEGTAGALTFRDDTAVAERMRIDSSGNVGIGTSSPGGKLHVKGGNASNIFVDNDGSQFTEIKLLNNSSGKGNWFWDNTATQMQFGTDVNAPLVLKTNTLERMRLDSSGNLLVGATSTAFPSLDAKTVSVTSSVQTAFFANVNAASSTGTAGIVIRKYDNNNTTSQIYLNFNYNQGVSGAGGIQGNGASGVQFYSSSDARLKENIVELEPQLANILALKPSKFDFIDGAKDCTGFIAQEMETVYPDVIGETPDGYKTIGGISIMETRLIKAIQEQQAMIEQLKIEVTALKGAK